MIAHLSGPAAWLLSAGWLNLLGPLAVWLFAKDRSAFVRTASSGAFNFTISMAVLSLVGWAMILSIILLPIGALLLGVSGFLVVALGAWGAFRTYHGRSFNYPWQVRVLS